MAYLSEIYFGESERQHNARGKPVKCQEIPKKYELDSRKALTRGHVICPTRADAVRILSSVVKSAVTMIDNTISELNRAREAACRGESLGWPNLSDVAACWLKYRLGVCIDDLSAWTKGPFESRTVAEVIRRLARPRNLLARNGITYVCEESCKSPSTYAWVRATDAAGACLRTPERIIHLCPPFWNSDHTPYREETIIHEAVHLTHCAAAEDEGRRVSIGSPECLAQFVAATNGQKLGPEFVGRCGLTKRCGAIPNECRLKPTDVGKVRPDWHP
jgi:Lysine-specific metallo-endopeptidase